MGVTLLSFAALCCIGIASAYPALRAVAPDKVIPSEKEYEALSKLGDGLMYLASVAWGNPQGIIDLMDDSDGSSENVDRKRAFNSQAHLENVRRVLTKRGQGPDNGDNALIEAVKEYGVYSALVGKVFVDGIILKNTKRAVDHAIALEGCKDAPETCPEKPDWEKIVGDAIMESAREAGNSGNSGESGNSEKRELIKRLLDLLN